MSHLYNLDDLIITHNDIITRNYLNEYWEYKSMNTSKIIKSSSDISEYFDTTNRYIILDRYTIRPKIYDLKEFILKKEVKLMENTSEHFSQNIIFENLDNFYEIITSTNAIIIVKNMNEYYEIPVHGSYCRTIKFFSNGFIDKYATNLKSRTYCKCFNPIIIFLIKKSKNSEEIPLTIKFNSETQIFEKIDLKNTPIHNTDNYKVYLNIDVFDKSDIKFKLEKIK
jgi:hypothetical protein